MKIFKSIEFTVCDRKMEQIDKVSSKTAIRDLGTGMVNERITLMS